ncbi:MAG: glycosyltransferase [Firmicutes bacterium]|nr:glycosyltransferase [Bacillota bacterium]
MKNKALIYLENFNIGGAQKSNLRMMKRLVADGWDVELVLRSSGGTLENQIPKEIKLNHLDRGLFRPAESDSQVILRAKALLRRITRIICIYLIKNKKYGLGVNGNGGLQPNAYFVGRYVLADVNLHWIRTDIDMLHKMGKPIDNLMSYAKYMHGFPCVSKATYESLIDCAPELTNRAFVLYNFYDKEEMLIKSEEDPNPYLEYDPELLKVVTVCRIHDRQKGVFRMLDVYRRLNDAGINFYWFVIGDGPDLKELIARAKYLGLSDGFILLGRSNNPFPYYRHADLCATLSNYEGLCGTVTEAKFMGKAVIATDFAGIHEQIQHLSNGYIVDNNEDAIFDGIKTLLLNKELLESITNYVLPTALSDENIKAEQLYTILDNVLAQNFPKSNATSL